MELIKNENTQFGFKWGNMDVIRVSEDDTNGVLVLKIKRADRTHILSISPSGDITIDSL